MLERTPVGRRVYATGGNVDAARLAGVRVRHGRSSARLIACGVIAALAGLLLTASVATGDPTVGPRVPAARVRGRLPRLDPVPRRPLQRLRAPSSRVYVLATGVKGLQLAGAPIWIPELFNGAALLLAVGMTKYTRRAARSSAISRAMGRTRRRAA